MIAHFPHEVSAALCVAACALAGAVWILTNPFRISRRSGNPYIADRHGGELGTMEPKKDKSEIPEKEWLSREAYLLHKAEQQVGGPSRRKLLWIALTLGLLGLTALGVLWLINRR